MLQVPSARKQYLVGPRKMAFSAVAPGLRNNYLRTYTEVKLAPSLLILQKPLKMRLQGEVPENQKCTEGIPLLLTSAVLS